MNLRVSTFFLGLFGLLLGATPAPAIIVGFEEFPAGYILSSADLPPGSTLTVTNNTAGHPNSAIIFDSSCPGGCTGGDGDLRTPGLGPGNDTPQGKVMIVAEDVQDVNGDGLVDDPDDEQHGGIISLAFATPVKLVSVRVIDIEASGEFPSEIQLDLVSGETEIVVYEELGNNSAQTVVVPDPQPANAIRFVFIGTGAVDDINIVEACGDGLLDEGEECDPPASQGGNPLCTDDCMLASLECGDGVVSGDEECDPPFSLGGDVGCRDNCTLAACGDGVVEAGEQCDPPASQGGDGACRDDCTLAVCGDGVVDTATGEQCDPPASQGGSPDCDDACMLVSDSCGDGVVDPPAEECDPPFSQGGAPNCNDECRLIECGDGVVEGDEECDPPFSQGGAPSCNDQCELTECGDGVVEGDEQCDPPASQGGDADCNDDCTRSMCGDEEIEAGEDCDPPESQGGEPGCSDECTFPCGDGVVDPGEDCDPPFSQGGDPSCNDACMSACGDGVVDPTLGEECDPPFAQGGDPDCSEMCTLLECGDGIVTPPEECDPPAIDGGDPTCQPDCTTGDPCGNGILEPGEECESPVGTEICDNAEDDDGDALIDCGDEDCVPADADPNDLPLFCNGICVESQCLRIKRDPAVIRFKDAPKHDFFSVHGRVDAEEGSFDPTAIPFRVILANLRGKFLDITLEPGTLQARGRRLFFFKNKAAKTQGAAAEGGGVFKIATRFRRVQGTASYTFKLRIYGDFSLAEPANESEVAELSDIQLLVYGVAPDLTQPGFNRSNWSRRKNAWVLRLSNL